MTAVNDLAKAADIMARVDQMDPLLPIARALTAQAQTYALMALAPIQVVRAATELARIRDAVTVQTNGAVL